MQCGILLMLYSRLIPTTEPSRGKKNKIFQMADIGSRLSLIEDQLKELCERVNEIKQDIKPIIAARIVWNTIPSYVRNLIKVYLVFIVIYDLNGFAINLADKLHLERLF